jgi:hypothetical protein
MPFDYLKHMFQLHVQQIKNIENYLYMFIVMKSKE